MLREEIDFIRHCLPDPIAMPYHADRESAWLLARGLREPTSVRALRQGPLAKLLDRPTVKPIVAACGGVLAPDDVAPAAAPEAFAMASGLSSAAMAGWANAFALDWLDFELTLTAWGTSTAYGYEQMSRPGGNLVLQLGFPSDHAALMGRYLGQQDRKWFEYAYHPVRQSGRPTLAWARLDLDMGSGSVLIEEIQSDWLRFVREDVEAAQTNAPRSRQLRSAQVYDAELRRRYGKVWPKAMMLAVLQFVTRELGCRDVWMHQPEAGAMLKGIQHRLPPRSIYTDLPKSFGFSATQDVPGLVPRKKLRGLTRLQRQGASLFWRLGL